MSFKNEFIEAVGLLKIQTIEKSFKNSKFNF